MTNYQWIWPLVLMATVTLASGNQPPGPQLPSWSPVPIDKLAHFLIFGLIATSIIRLGARGDQIGAHWLVASILTTSLFGAIDELHQSFNPDRFVEFADWIADTSGAVVASLSYQYLRVYRRILELPIIKRNALSRQITIRRKRALSAKAT